MIRCRVTEMVSITVTLPTGETYEQPTGLFINNEFIASQSTIETIDPSTKKVITSVHVASSDDIDNAVKAARNTAEYWGSLSGSERGEYLYKLVALIERDADILAKIDALDAGKPYESNAKSDLEQIIELTKYYAGYADKIKGSYLPLGEDKFVYETHEPYGVVSLLIPWNYPLAMASWKMIGAVTAGNTVIAKSSEYTPLSLLYFAKLVKEAGFPPGVFNIVSGLGPVAGSRMASHPDVDKVAFTGSTKTGQTIQRLAAENLKAVTLECGGKSPGVVFEDSDLKDAAKWLALGICYNSGQNCTANSRIIIHESIHDEFIKHFIKEIQTEWIVGSPFSQKNTMGPVINQLQYDKIKSYIKIAEEEGLKKVLGDEPVPNEGFYIAPTVYTSVPSTSRLFQEEIFGPVAVITTFKTYEEALQLANGTQYGLGAAIFTQNVKKAHKFARGVKAGTVWINSSNDEDIRASFGGFKLSGIGRELGLAGIQTYTQTKSIHVSLRDVKL